MKAKQTSKKPRARTERAKPRSVERVVGAQRRAQKDPIKEAWMAGARAGTEVAWELMSRAIENMGRTLGIQKKKRPNAKLSESARENQ
jgi:hypothetical protein